MGETKKINLALQGGGAHGAFGWGVLDRLAEDERLDIEGISGTSAGSINAVVYAHGRMQGGRAGARSALEDFWRKVSGAGQRYSPLQGFGWAEGSNLNYAPGYLLFETMTRAAADAWLARNYADLGERSTVDLNRDYLDAPVFGPGA